jgi:predicted HAD superfamily Cof-like phosphohydrolase
MTPLPQFFDAYGVDRPQVPQARDKDTVDLCRRLIAEEYKEVVYELRQLALQAELGSPTEARLATLGKLLKELADLRYVVEYAAVAHGLDIDAAYEEVHRSNMSKLGLDGNPIIVEGKVQKGPLYRAPDMEQFLQVHDAEVSDA